MDREFDRYQYYQDAVQSPKDDAAFLDRVYQEEFKRPPKSMREDFCAAFALCCAWVKRDPSYEAIGVDIDPEPLEYGKAHYAAKLSSNERERVQILQRNVLDPELPTADIICALNFSYMGIKERPHLKEYFSKCLLGLGDRGVLVLDCFGGGGTQEPNENETEYDDFSYFWDQDTWNPVTHEAQFYIHFKRKGEPKREKVFSYDWRMWSLPELRDLLKEVGFSQVKIYWEGTDEDGDGNGEFALTTEGDQCESWVAYVVAVKD